MKFKITKLNKRNTWHQFFTHRVEILRTPLGTLRTPGQYKVANFNKVRLWCWDNFGPSCETYQWEQLKATPEAELANNEWAWFVNAHDSYRSFIYFNDSALAFFQLEWAASSDK